ncbi:MAG: HAD-IIA family hydrolase [Bacteroidetes bacterium]|jgi:HAD superfamily hydrolase (TIGR01450 family)|nr:MAG: HAD-IIA family hydrolase [Bacteroidota bacterium]
MENFKTLAEKYKIIFFDAYGVIKNYKGLIPGIEKTFEWLQQQSKGYYVITNDASRSPELLADAFFKAGLKAITPDRIISSGMLAKEFLDLKVKKGLVAYLGTEDSAHYIEHPGLDTLPLQQMNENNIHDITALVLLDDEGFDWNDGLNKAVNLLRQRPIPAIIANPDGAYPMSKREVSIAIGGLAYMVEKITGKKFIRFGKPDSQIFMFAWEYIIQHYPGMTKKDILMVGDTLHTDILGGNKFGLDTALVLTGNLLPEDYESRIFSTGIIPTYICESAVIN